MEKKLICGKKYEFSHQTIQLPISLENLPEEIKVKGDTFYFPSSFHVSLVYIGKIIEKYSISIPNFENKIIEDFCNFVKTDKVELVTYTNEYKFAFRNNLKTVVVMCEVSNINKFFDLINKKYRLNIRYPVTHVTLYNTLKGKPGIYLMDSEDIENFTVPIENPIGRSL